MPQHNLKRFIHASVAIRLDVVGKQRKLVVSEHFVDTCSINILTLICLLMFLHYIDKKLNPGGIAFLPKQIGWILL